MFSLWNCHARQGTGAWGEAWGAACGATTVAMAAASAASLSALAILRKITPLRSWLCPEPGPEGAPSASGFTIAPNLALHLRRRSAILFAAAAEEWRFQW